jgi:hypothetical protein
LLFQLAGNFLLFKAEQHVVKKEIKAKIKSSLSINEITQLIFTTVEYNSLKWKEKHEFYYNGNLYDLIESKTVTVKPAGEWNLARLISNKGHLEFWLNGNKQVETEMFTPAWEAMIKTSKFKDMPDFGKFHKGRISLQDHGDMVWYRNIKIKTL